MQVSNTSAEEYLVLPESSFLVGNKAYMNHLSKCVSQMCAKKTEKCRLQIY